MANGSGPSAPGPSPRTDRPALRIGLIWAQARGGVIGAGGSMPWHLPEDLRHFSRTTTGSPVVMGRRTWESFPPRFRPLPGRTNIVITRDDSFAVAGAVRARGLPDALELARQSGLAQQSDLAQEIDPDTVWVIGGGAVYREAIADADLLVVTEIDLDVAGDTTAPPIPSAFRPVSADPPSGWHTGADDLRYRIVRYER